MVHLAQIPTDKHVAAPLVEGMEKLKIQSAESDDSFTTTVYGSRFASENLPKFEMPEKEMPKEVAYRMIKDDLSLDGNPMLNLASFVTTFMVGPYLVESLAYADNLVGERSRGSHDRVLLQELH